MWDAAPPSPRKSAAGGAVMELEVVHPACAGLDVHKKTVVACALTPAGREVRSFRAMTAGLQELADWLAQQQVSQVVMEATGVYWRRV